MPKYRTVGEFCSRARRTAEESGISDALMMIVEMVDFVISHDSSRARVFASKELDILCLELGRGVAQNAPSKLAPERSVFLATAIFPQGGHTRLMKALMNADHGTEQFVLLTNVSYDLKIQDVPPFIDAANVSICQNLSLEERVRWLQRELLRIAPQRIYLFPHHFDAVAVAAVQPGLCEQLFFVHHCDHSLALGVHIPHAIHVDLHAKGFFYCREMEGIHKNVMWPVVASANVAPRRKFLSGRGLKTSTSGGSEKFESPHLREEIPYSISYADVVPRIINASAGTHLHIGQLSENLQKTIRNNLDACGIAQDRFVQISYVPKLAEALVLHEIDVYVCSFPLGGGLAVVEAMSAGLPILTHSNYRTTFFADKTQIYPKAMTWRRVSELEDTLSSITKEDLVRHSRLSRGFFEEHHLPIHLKEAISATIVGKGATLPPRPIHCPNALQSFLDEQEAVAERDAQIASAESVIAHIAARYAANIASAESVIAHAAGYAANSAKQLNTSFFKFRKQESKIRLPSSVEPEAFSAMCKSVFFDAEFYLDFNADVKAAGLDPALHYLLRGGLERRDPGPFFSTSKYLDQNPDVAAAGMNALVHYELQGRREGRKPPRPDVPERTDKASSDASSSTLRSQH